jgi:S1-C subfamily serine protease
MRVGWVQRLGVISATIAALVLISGADEPARKVVGLPKFDKPKPIDDLTFRPTVVIRKGAGQGSGIVIASVPGETLVLTVAHVVSNEGELTVELHRFNLGLEREKPGGEWPRVVQARILAADVSADVAVISLRGLPGELPYVARLADGNGEPAKGTVVTSVGIDRGSHLSGWTAKVEGLMRKDLKKTGRENLFLVTDKAPDHGRSGGGLFGPDGRLVGVCVGRNDQLKTGSIGIFASGTSIRRLLKAADLTATIVDSDQRHFAANLAPQEPVTPTGNRPAGR